MPTFMDPSFVLLISDLPEWFFSLAEFAFNDYQKQLNRLNPEDSVILGSQSLILGCRNYRKSHYRGLTIKLLCFQSIGKKLLVTIEYECLDYKSKYQRTKYWKTNSQNKKILHGQTFDMPIDA